MKRRASTAMVERLFAVERDRFARVYPRVALATLAITSARCPSPPCADRDYATAAWDTGRIVLARRALALPRENLVGILRHELGHIADPTPDADEAEARADAIVRFVTGEPVRYDSRGVQTVGRGGKRPNRLHR